MTDPGFKIEGIHQAVPFRPRAAFDGYCLFGGGDSAVLVAPATVQALRSAARNARPLETGGLLSGRALRDADGHYVVVSGFVEAEPGSGRAAAFEISPQATARLREESSRASPTADVVGWWHSHLRPSPYSQTDLTTQSIWRQLDSVGLLVFADGEPWAAAHMGPDARKLGCPIPAHSHRQSDSSSPVYPDGDGRVVAEARHGQPVLTIPSPPRHHAWQLAPQQRGLVRLLALVATVLILMLVLALYMLVKEDGLAARIESAQRVLSGRISSEQHQLSGEIKRTLVTPHASPSINWSCVSAPPPSGSYSCNAKTSESPGMVQWKLDGKLYTTGPRVTIHVPQDRNTHTIEALLKTPTGTFPGTVQTIPSG
jgi:proteasome lid subunit RPN8/RPN11